MGKVYRFLSVLMLVVSFSATTFVAKETVACWSDGMSDKEAQEVLKKAVLSGSSSAFDEELNAACWKSLGQIYLNLIGYNTSGEHTVCPKICKELGNKQPKNCRNRCENQRKAMLQKYFDATSDECQNARQAKKNGLSAKIGGSLLTALGFATVATGVGTLFGLAMMAGGIAAYKAGDMIMAGAVQVFENVMNAFLSVSKGCWFCPIFKTVFDTINTLATTLYGNLRDLCFALLAIAGTGWLLWTVFRFITTIHGPNVGELMTKLFKGLGTIMLIAIILRQPPSFITRYIVDPVAALGTGLSNEILKAQGYGTDGTREITTYTTSAVNCGDGVEGYRVIGQQRQERICELANPSDFEGKTLSADIYNDMSCLLRRISLELVWGIALGAALITKAFEPIGLPNLRMLLAGMLLLLSYFCLYVSVPFKLIDLLLRLGFTIIMLPIFIVCMATPATRGYSKKGWDMFVSCWISLIALSLFVVLAMTIMSTAVGGVEAE